MEIKKSPKADLESKKSTWLLVGYVIVLAFMFVAFEWTKRDIKIDTSQAITDVFFEADNYARQDEKAIPMYFLKRKSSLLQNSRSRLLLRLPKPLQLQRR